jgi:biopolymer transport protein ExbD
VASWDVFHADRLELERGLETQTIRLALSRGDLRDDDLVRPAGSTIPWARLADIPELIEPPESARPAGPLPAAPGRKDAGARPGDALEDFEEVQPSIEQIIPPPSQHQPTRFPDSTSSDVAFPVFEEEPRQPHPHDLGPVDRRLSQSGWIWPDEDEEHEDVDDEQREIVQEEQDDIEILEDDDPLETSDEDRSGTPTFIPGRAGPSSAHPAESRPSAGRRSDRWELSENDLDLKTRPESRSSHVALPVVRSRDRDLREPADETAEDAETGFSLSRSATERIEELDLAPMVDVAFNLVLFFMVTATTVLYKTLEVPKPSGEAPASAVAQGRSRSLDDLKDDYILVEIDDRGAMKVDREPIEPVMDTLVERLRRAREKTGRKAMLLSAEFATLHRNAVLAYDAANEIGLGIAIAKPQAPQGPAPTLRSAPAAALKSSAPPTAAPPF